MGSLNKAMLIGNLGRDAEMRYTSDGTAVATLNLATTETWKDKEGQKQKKTEWHRIIVWGKTAESLNEYPRQGETDPRRRQNPNPQVGRQGRRDALLDRDQVRPDHAAWWRGQRDESDQRRGNDGDESGKQPLNKDDIPF